MPILIGPGSGVAGMSCAPAVLAAVAMAKAAANPASVARRFCIQDIVTPYSKSRLAL